jgi:hypothetical protein
MGSPSEFGAASPEELETLLEDAFVLADIDVLRRLFDRGAVLLSGGRHRVARGHAEIADVAAEMVRAGSSYISDPREIVHGTGIALTIGGNAINVMRRGADRSWRYVISVIDRAP